jgi:hypothetical protein
MVGMDIPLLPLAHQYAKTTRFPNSSAATPKPPRRACRSCATKTRTFISANLSIVSASAPMPTARCQVTYATSADSADISASSMPSMLPFTDEDFAQPWEQCKLLLPA